MPFAAFLSGAYEMKKVTLSLIAALAASVSAPVIAQDDRAGDIQIKVLGTAVLPDGEIDEVNLDNFGLPAGANTRATDEFIPSFAIEYFLSNNFSIETIAGMAKHDVDGTGALNGVELVDDLRLIPGTVTAKAHLDLGGVKPYVGAGVAYFMFFGEDEGSDLVGLGVTDADLSNEFGFALQAGFDIPIEEAGFGVSVDVKRYFIGTDATFSVNGTDIIRTEHNLDPWTISAGVTFTL